MGIGYWIIEDDFIILCGGIDNLAIGDDFIII